MITDARLDPALLKEVVSSILGSMCGLDISPRAPSQEEWSVTGLISMTGAVNYCFMLQTRDRLALEVASKMLQEPISVWGPGVEDALGELVNIVAGNLKRHIETGLQLSMPTVIHGERYALSSPRMDVTQTGDFACQGEPLQILLGRAR